MKIAYVGFDLFYPAFEQITNAGCEIIKIFTCETDQITEFHIQIQEYAKTHHIPCTLERINEKDIEELKEAGCELLICAGYDFKIPTAHELRMVNIHPTILPEGRGGWPMPYAILHHKKRGGVTIHKITEQFDQGDILLQASFSLAANETHKTYMEKVYKELPDLLKHLLAEIDKLWERAVPQSKGEYWAMPKENDYTICDEMTVEQADLILRAFYGYVCIYQNKKQTYEVIEGRAVKRERTSRDFLYLRDGVIEAPRIRKRNCDETCDKNKKN